MSNTKKTQRSEAFKTLINWRFKVDFLKNQISILDKMNTRKHNQIFVFSSFLLKSNLIEFELTQLLPTLIFHLNLNNSSKILEIKTKTPKDLNKKTLGALLKELEKYKGSLVDELITSIKKFKVLRNKLIHHLFDLGNVEDLIVDSEEGIEKADKVILEIEKINKLITENELI